MVVSVYLFETRGGALITQLDPSGYNWSVQVNTAETLSVTLKTDGDTRNLLTPWKHSLAFDVDGLLLGGPVLPYSYDADKTEVQVTARGLRYMFDNPPILPVSALTGDIAPDGLPDPAFDTTISGVDLGTIGKRLVQQAMMWPGWVDIPITFHADRPGAATRTYTAADLSKTVDSALSDLSGVENGPDIRFRLLRTSDDSFGWVYESGTATQPRLQGEVPLVWETEEAQGLNVRTDPQVMGSMSWSMGGRTADKTLIRSLYDPFLVDQGFPLLHVKSDASTSTSELSTLDKWNVEALRTARVPAEFWSLKVPTDVSPFPFEYAPGDLATIIVKGDAFLAGTSSHFGGDEFPLDDMFPADDRFPPQFRVFEDGRIESTRRIVALSGDDSTDFITVTFGVNYGGG